MKECDLSPLSEVHMMVLCQVHMSPAKQAAEEFKVHSQGHNGNTDI